MVIYTYIYICIHIRIDIETCQNSRFFFSDASKETYICLKRDICPSQNRRMYTPKKTCQESRLFFLFASKETCICLKRDVCTYQKRCMNNPKETCQESRQFSFDALAAPSLPPLPLPLPAPPCGVLRGRGGFVGEASLYLCVFVCGECFIWNYYLCASYGMATISRLLQMIGLFCRISSLL